MTLLLNTASSLRDMTAEHVTDHTNDFIGFWIIAGFIALGLLIAGIFAEDAPYKFMWFGLTALMVGGMVYAFFHIKDAREDTVSYMQEVESSISSEIESSYDVASATPQFDSTSPYYYNIYIDQLNTRDTEEAAMIAIELQNGDVYDYSVFFTSNDDLVLRSPQADSDLPSPSELVR